MRTHINKELSLISVIIITYNRAEYLRESMSSVLCQTYSNLELIVLDDGSTDHTKQVVAEFNDERIRYHRIEHMGVISAVRNISLTLASGSYLAFLDSDDMWYENKLEVQLGQIADNGAEAAFSRVKVFCEDGSESYLNVPQSLSERSKSGDILIELIMNRLAIYISTLIFKNSVLQKVANFDTSRNVNEVGFISRILTHCEVCFSPKCLAAIRKHNGNSSVIISAEENFREKFTIIENLLESDYISTATYKEAMLNHYHALLRSQNPGLNMERSWHYFLKCIWIKPYSLRTITAVLHRLKFVLVKMAKHTKSITL